MDSDGISILIMVICVILSGFFSASETAFSSMNGIRMKAQADDGDKRAARALRLAEDFDRLLSTILVGNNIVNILMTAVATVLFVRYFQSAGTTLATLVTTVVVLIFGEISPKSLAKESPEAFAKFAAPFLRALTVILTPVNFLFKQWKKLLSRLFKTPPDDAITERELLTMVEEAEQGGAIDEQESELISNAIAFGDVQAADIFTPRVDVVALPEDADRETAARVFAESGFSRLPVYRETIDHIVGILHQRDFLALPAGEKGIASIVKPAVFITKSMKVDDLLRMLQKNKAHMAILCDEFGGTMGLITIEDILEELVGEIWDEHEDAVEEIHRLDERTWRVQGGADLEEFYEEVGILPDEDDEETATVGGWAMARLDKIPDPGDRFESDGLLVTVESVTDNRIDSLLVTRPDSPKETDALSS